MAQRLFVATKWLLCIFALQISLKVVNTLSVPTKEPYGIESQAKFFQDFFSVQLSPYNIEFGHVCEDPHTWEQRYEKKDFKNHRDMGKVRWGDKNGGYGEHYWDLNHAGYTDNHGGDYNGDDGSYHEDPSDVYDSPDVTNSYDSESYSEDSPQYEENGRIKRAHPKTAQKTEDSDDYDEPRVKQRIQTKNKNRRERYEEKYQDDEDDEDLEPTTKSPKSKKERVADYTAKGPKNKDRQSEYDYERPQKVREKNHYVLVVNQKDKEDEIDQTPQNKHHNEPKRFVNYEDGAGVRHNNPEAIPSASAPRLFLETQTGHIVDRMTGQAYVLQPLVNKYNN